MKFENKDSKSLFFPVHTIFIPIHLIQISFSKRKKRLPKNAKILLHIHYGPTGVPLKDSSMVRLKFSKPIVLKKGTIVHALAKYDNTLDNPSNPSDLPRAMKWGKRMFDELFLVYFEFLPMIEKNEIELSFNPTTIWEDEMVFHFISKVNQKLNLDLKNFRSQNSIPIFKDKLFTKGKHLSKVSLKDLELSNYFLEKK